MLQAFRDVVPRRLRMAVAVIVVLGVVSCGAGVLRPPESAPPSLSRGQTETADSLPLLSPPRVRPEELSGCGAEDGAIALSASACTVVAPRAGLRPAKLVLQLASGAATVTVSQTVEGRSFTESSSESPFEVTTSRSGPSVLTISCPFSCALTVEAP